MDPDCSPWFCQTMPASRVQARGRSGLTRRLTMCAGRPPPLPVWRSTSASQWPRDAQRPSHSRSCQIPHVRHLSSEGAPVSSSGSVRELPTGHAKLVNLVREANIVTRRLAACCVLCQGHSCCTVARVSGFRGSEGKGIDYKA